MLPRFVFYENVKRVAFWRAVFCELLATAILVFIGCGSIILQLNPEATISASTTTRIALAFGFAVNILIKTFGPVSGCHINPAVSIAFMIVGKVSMIRALFYALAEIAGAVMGAGLLYAVLPTKYRTHLGNTKLLNDVTPGQGVATEVILTYILVLAISACLDEKRIDHFKMKITNPLTIGFTISALHLVGIPFTGASMNPARSFGPAVILQHWSNHWVYWVGPITGACLASLTYYYLISPQKLLGNSAAHTNPTSGSIEDEGTSSKLGGRHRPPVNRHLSVMSTVSETVDVPLESYNFSASVDLENAGYNEMI